MEICLSDGQRMLVFGFHQDEMDAAIEDFNQLQLYEKVTHFLHAATVLIVSSGRPASFGKMDLDWKSVGTMKGN